MSADLFEAFGSDLQLQAGKSNRDNAKPAVTATQNHLAAEAGQTWQSWPSHPSIYTAASQRPAQGLWEQDQQGNNFLFDAESHEAGTHARLECDEDDFGEFEQAHADAITAPSETAHLSFKAQSANLLDLDEHETAVLYNDLELTSDAQSQRPGHIPITTPKVVLPIENVCSQAAKLSATDSDWSHFEDVADFKPSSGDNKQSSVSVQPLSQLSPMGRTDPNGINKAQQNLLSAVSTKPEQATNDNEDGFGDDWDDFEDGPSGTPAEGGINVLLEAQHVPKPSIELSNVPRERPTNIPPPAVLLALLPKVFSSLAAHTHQPGAEDSTGKTALGVYRVCARIIGGRQLRWKRDTILAQSMRIGAAGRSGGMKLTSLDKGESRKEDQEAEEAIASWSRSSHRLNAAMMKAKVTRPPIALSTNLAVRTATGPDVLTANHICPVCGLKRNERINGIDVDVSDTFGEFWVEHWGHKDCYELWYQYSKLLDQR